MGVNFVWVKARCKNGHDMDPQSRVRHDYCGYSMDAVPLDVAIDLRDNPWTCNLCRYAGDTTETQYVVRFVSAPRNVCEHCGKPSACNCYAVVAIEFVVYAPKTNS